MTDVNLIDEDVSAADHEKIMAQQNKRKPGTHNIWYVSDRGLEWDWEEENVSGLLINGEQLGKLDEDGVLKALTFVTDMSIDGGPVEFGKFVQSYLNALAKHRPDVPLALIAKSVETAAAAWGAKWAKRQIACEGRSFEHRDGKTILKLIPPEYCETPEEQKQWISSHWKRENERVQRLQSETENREKRKLGRELTSIAKDAG